VDSPVLANIYLHHALDLWFEHIVRKECRGEVYMIRYADDFVCAFQYQADAQRFERQLPERLGKFGLETAPEKTRTLIFSRFQAEKNGTFEFLGFEYRWVKRRAGKLGVQRRTAPKKLRASVKAFTEWIKKHRHTRKSDLMRTLAAKLRGYWNYYGVRGNMRMLTRFYYQCRGLLYKWLNRRSEKRSMTWGQLDEMLRRRGIPPPSITEPLEQMELFGDAG